MILSNFNIPNSIILVSLLLIVNCTRTPIFYHLEADYFPIDNIGNRWVYKSNQGTTKSVEVIKSILKGNRKGFVVTENGITRIWSKTLTECAEHITVTIVFNAEEIIMEQRWKPHLRFPLMLGNKWQDNFENEVTINGITLRREVVTEAEVIALETINVPAGLFKECYKIKFKEITRSTFPFQDEITPDTTITVEWYAPNVGIVKYCVNDTSSFELMNYTVN